MVAVTGSSIDHLPALPDWLISRGADPKQTSLELAHVIRTAIDTAPRSQQTALGPSELGDPCARRIGHKIIGSPQRAQAPNWKATVGTAVHSWLAAAFDADNLAEAFALGSERWLVETRVDVGEAAGQMVSGTVDLYDRITATVIDWKTCGPSMLDHYKHGGPGDTYRAQVNLYGLGLSRLGLPVETVMIVFLPRQGELADAYTWHEAYDPELAATTLERYAGIHYLVDVLGDAAPDVLPMAPAWCLRCPFYGGPCPGHPNAQPPGASAPALTLNP
jgi:hypothetical protein